MSDLFESLFESLKEGGSAEASKLPFWYAPMVERRKEVKRLRDEIRTFRASSEKLFRDLSTHVATVSGGTNALGRLYHEQIERVWKELGALAALIIPAALELEHEIEKLRIDFGSSSTDETIRALREKESAATCELRPAIVHKAHAESAIRELCAAANVGDVESIRALRDIGLNVSRELEKLADAGLKKFSDTGEVPVLDIVKKSGSWPIAVSALEDGRAVETEGKLKEWRFGYGLPFRVRQKSGRGNTRAFHQGAQSRFALDVCVILENERSSYISSLTDVESREFQRARNKEDWVVKFGRHQIDELWCRKAAALPVFSAQADVRRAWLDAGMEYLRAECNGDWHLLKLPSCVEDRAVPNGKKGKPRSVRSSIEEKLEKGIEALCK